MQKSHSLTKSTWKGTFLLWQIRRCRRSFLGEKKAKKERKKIFLHAFYANFWHHKQKASEGRWFFSCTKTFELFRPPSAPYSREEQEHSSYEYCLYYYNDDKHHEAPAKTPGRELSNLIEAFISLHCNRFFFRSHPHVLCWVCMLKFSFYIANLLFFKSKA